MIVSGKNGKATRGMERAIAALIANPSVSKAAKAAGLTEATLYRYLRLDDFQAEYQAARRQIVHHSIAVVQAAMSEAVGTLRSIMTDSQAPASARVSAARVVIDTGLRAVEYEDLELRLAALESQLKEKNY